MTNTEFAKRLGWSESVVGARLDALGLTIPCTRCGGTGHYSFNQMDGTRCFKCRGRRMQMPKLTAKLAARAAELVAAGGLVEYLATVERKREAKRVIPALAKACYALYAVIAKDYTRVSADPMITAAELVASPLFVFQGRANALYYGADGRRMHPWFMSVCEIRGAAEKGNLETLEASRLLEARRVEIAALVSEYLAHLFAGRPVDFA